MYKCALFYKKQGPTFWEENLKATNNENLVGAHQFLFPVAVEYHGHIFRFQNIIPGPNLTNIAKGKLANDFRKQHIVILLRIASHGNARHAPQVQKSFVVKDPGIGIAHIHPAAKNFLWLLIIRKKFILVLCLRSLNTAAKN